MNKCLLFLYIYFDICMYIYIHTHIYIYIHFLLLVYCSIVRFIIFVTMYVLPYSSWLTFWIALDQFFSLICSKYHFGRTQSYIELWEIWQLEEYLGVYLTRSGSIRISYWIKKSNYLAFFLTQICAICYSRTLFLALSLCYVCYFLDAVLSLTLSFFQQRTFLIQKILYFFKLVKFNLIFYFL